MSAHVKARSARLPSSVLEKPSSSVAVGGDELRRAIGHFATGVTVVTTGSANGPLGSTANAVSSVSLDPPLLLVCLRHRSKTLAALLERGYFAVNVLADTQLTLAQRFAKSSPGGDWEDIAHSFRANGVPLLDDAVAQLECVLHEVAGGGDHQIVIGRVVGVAHPEHHIPPLLFYRGAFAKLDPHNDKTSPPLQNEIYRPTPAQQASGDTDHPVDPHDLRGHASDVVIPTPQGQLSLVPINQHGRPFTSVIALVGDPRRSHGSLVYMHQGCFFGDALGHLHCRRARALTRALEMIKEEGRGIVIYHRDDSAPFNGCCVAQTEQTPQSTHSEDAWDELRNVLQGLDLRAVRLMLSSTNPLPEDALGLNVASTTFLEFDP